MNTKFFWIISLLTIGLFQSCQNNLKGTENGTINIERILSINKEINISSICHSMSAIQLETIDESLLPDKSEIVKVGKNDIFIKGDNKLFRFQKSGRFLNKIGRIGQGPMEYTYIRSISFNDHDSTICIYGGENNIYIYKYNGEPIRSVILKTNGYISLAFGLSTGFWAEERMQDEDGTTINIAEFDGNGNRILNHTLLSINKNVRSSYLPAPIVHQISDSTFQYYSGYVDSLYYITTNGIRGLKEIYMGKYGINQNELSDMDYRTHNRLNLCEIWDILPDNNYTTILLRKGEQLYMAIVYSDTGECFTSFHIDDPRKGGGIRFGKGSDVRVWPHIVSEGKLYTLLNTVDLNSSKDIKIYNPNRNSNKSNIDPNPVFLEVKLKNVE